MAWQLVGLASNQKACVVGTGLFFSIKEEISRTGEERKGVQVPAVETLVFHLCPQFNNVTALQQLKADCIANIRPKGKNSLVNFCYICIEKII